MNVLLVEPNFPIPLKSRNHKNFLPVGLLKIASYLRSKGESIDLVRGVPENLERNSNSGFIPDEIWITSLFTYWSRYVKESVENYRKYFPEAKIKVGGIYATLMPKHCKKYTGCDEVQCGVIKEAEKFLPAYDLIKNMNSNPIDYQIIHTSRGCDRHCSFCGTWQIEPKFKTKKSIKDEIKFRNVVFYDNNFLSNPYIEDILIELVDLKKEKKILWCESQSGLDGRVLLKKPYLSKLLKEAGFRYPRIAWDWEYKEYHVIKRQIDILEDAGFRSKDIYIFMLYNWKIRLDEMEKKRKKCWKWKVQIADCRFRPLYQTYDYYSPNRIQSNNDYFIDPNWSDSLIKQFRKNIRRQNICVRQEVSFYSRKLERKYKSRNETRRIKKMNREELSFVLDDAWFPSE